MATEDLNVIPASEILESDLRPDDVGTLLYDDAAALKLVLDDTSAADNFININQWAARWQDSAIIYQSPTGLFDGSGNPGRVPKFTLSNHCSAIVPKLMEGIFYEDPPFLLRPRPKTTQEVVRAKTALFAAQLDEMKFEEEVERGLDQMTLNGTGVWKWGWLDSSKKVKKRVRKKEPTKVTDASGKVHTIHTEESDEFDIVYETQEIHRPWFSYVDRRTVLVDPSCRYGDIQRAKWVVYRDYATYRDLDALRDVPGYDIPSEEVLKTFFFRDKATAKPDNLVMTLTEQMRGWLQSAMPRNYNTSADPLAGSLEILERWDKDMVIVILCHKGDNILIRNEANPYGKVPFFSANWRNIPDAFDGQGLGQLIGAEQVVEEGITNLALGLLAFELQPTAVRKKGFNTPTQPIKWKQGGIIDVEEDVDKAFKFLQMPQVSGNAWNFLQASQATSQETSGANQQVMLGAGAAGTKTTGMRSGTGAAGIISANASRLDGPDGRFIRQVFVPWLYQMDELNNDLLPASFMRKVLSDELGDDFEVDHMDFRNAVIEYEVLAGSHMGPKKEMAQFLPFIVQLINNPTFSEMISNAGFMFDAVATFKNFADLAGWKYSQQFIRPMTAPEKQRADLNTPARLQAMKNQAAQQALVTKFQQEEQLQNEKQLGKAGGEVMRTAIEHAMDSEAVSGEPGNTGFGSETAL